MKSLINKLKGKVKNVKHAKDGEKEEALQSVIRSISYDHKNLSPRAIKNVVADVMDCLDEKITDDELGLFLIQAGVKPYQKVSYA